MESVYVPPHLRKKAEPTTVSDAPPTSVAIPSVVPSSKLQERSDDNLYTVQEIHTYFWGEGAGAEDTHNATLHSSAANPNGLSWVLLFNGANPKWDEDGVIFVKSNLNLLTVPTPASELKSVIAVALPAQRLDKPGEDGGVMLPTSSEVADEDYEEGSSSGTPEPTTTEPLSDHPNERVLIDYSPIAVFSQVVRRDSRPFKFIGWYEIEHLQILEPGSQGLLHMLWDKWNPKDKHGNYVPRQRGSVNLMKSMSYSWAVVQMKKDEEAMENKGEPKIERMGNTEDMTGDSEGQSVNEMLAQMRLEGEGNVVAPEEGET
ncbi:uncharacterized protein J4E84_004422 [Alternaria hordeiaustralica]|uniref:uncharacterized protein n=1 Tax=Alternaria hordeiaustralica TaxID=1187925 RepID=UPI0020C5382F|nr:uncharacterized protein J4E84_004422 [Alternaria hordeiaustralica]KAI4690238.1 hypothetical protein J4E84_004422 [Alternaria hordeiaustralica]